MAMKTITKNEAASNDDEVATRDVSPIVDIATFMKQPFTYNHCRKSWNTCITF